MLRRSATGFVGVSSKFNSLRHRFDACPMILGRFSLKIFFPGDDNVMGYIVLKICGMSGSTVFRHAIRP